MPVPSALGKQYGHALGIYLNSSNDMPFHRVICIVTGKSKLEEQNPKLGIYRGNIM